MSLCEQEGTYRASWKEPGQSVRLGVWSRTQPQTTPQGPPAAIPPGPGPAPSPHGQHMQLLLGGDGGGSPGRPESAQVEYTGLRLPGETTGSSTPRWPRNAPHPSRGQRSSRGGLIRLSLEEEREAHDCRGTHREGRGGPCGGCFSPGGFQDKPQTRRKRFQNTYLTKNGYPIYSPLILNSKKTINPIKRWA